uniref:Putative signal transduction protein n=1 Tax=Desulfovibrio sp. U5L TaxID=596152 RepID=I2PWC8_9BACT
MKQVNIEDAAQGMVAGEDVRGADGALVLARGTAVDEAHLRAMRAYGVRNLSVVSDEAAPGEAGPGGADDSLAATEGRCRALLAPRFAALDLDAPFGRTVFDLAARRAAARALACGLDLDAVPAAPPHLAPPPEESLFCARGVDPQSLVSGEVELASLPEVHLRLLEALNSEKTSAGELSAIIGRDPSLAARLLKLVNSPAYGSRVPVDTISRAVALVGRAELATLVMGLAAVNAFGDIDPKLCDMRAFWSHGAACGTYAALLAAACPGTAPDRVFVGGLLHDIGQLVILRRLPAAAGRALLLSRIEGLPLAEAEDAVLGFDHAAVSRALLEGWHFPDTLTAMAAGHHQPDGRPEARETALVHVADILATAWAWPAFAGAPVPALSEPAWRSLGLSASVLPGIAAAGEDRIRDTESVFFPAQTPPPARPHANPRKRT